MESKTVLIPAISCGHCVQTVQNELGELDGVLRVQADEASKQTTIEWSAPATWEQIKALLAEINYPAQDLVMP